MDLGWISEGVSVTKYSKKQQLRAIWSLLSDLPDPADEAEQDKVVSRTAAQTLPSTRAGVQDEVSSKQTPSNYILFCL